MATNTSNKNTIMGWVDRRLPVTENLERHLTKHPVPKKVNFFYLFGALLMVVFMIQVITGIWLMMFYTNTEEGAFASVEFIMRDVEYGWLMRYMHSTGASAFFFLMYFHMFRGLLYGSYQKPKELVWLFGCFLLFLLMAEGFWVMCFLGDKCPIGLRMLFFHSLEQFLSLVLIFKFGYKAILYFQELPFQDSLLFM